MTDIEIVAADIPAVGRYFPDYREGAARDPYRLHQ